MQDGLERAVGHHGQPEVGGRGKVAEHLVRARARARVRVRVRARVGVTVRVGVGVRVRVRDRVRVRVRREVAEHRGGRCLCLLGGGR